MFDPPDDVIAPDRPLRVAVLAKQIPVFEDMVLGPDGRMVRDGIDMHMNDYCRRAVAKGTEVARASGGTVTVLTLGPPSAEKRVSGGPPFWGGRRDPHLRPGIRRVRHLGHRQGAGRRPGTVRTVRPGDDGTQLGGLRHRPGTTATRRAARAAVRHRGSALLPSWRQPGAAVGTRRRVG